MSVRPRDDVWEVRGLPVLGDPSDPAQVTAESRAASLKEDGRGGGGAVSRVAVIRKQRFVRLELERRREMRLVEVHIERSAVEEARRMDTLLGYGEDDLLRWKQKVEPRHFSTYSAADFTSLMDDLHAIYRARQETIADCFGRQMSLEAERTARLRDVFKKYHPLLTRAFHKMPAEVEEQLELETVSLNEMVLNNLRQYLDIRFSRLMDELRAKQKLQQLWKVCRDAWRTLNILQAERRLSEYLRSAAVEGRVEASLAELETQMDTVWQHYREHLTGLPDLFVEQVTDESVDQWQDRAYEILNSMSTLVTTHCQSYRKLYRDLENAWYTQLDKVGDDLVNREVTDVDQWESLADRHTADMFGPIRGKVESRVTAAQQRWNEVVRAAPGQVDHLYSYIASSCEVFSLHLAERVRHEKKLELQLQALDSQQAVKESQLEQKISKAMSTMMEESKVTRVHQLQQTLDKQMTAFLPTYEQFQERRLQLLLAHSERLEAETLLAQASVAEKLEASVTSPETPPPEPGEDCHRLLAACRGVLLAPTELTELQSVAAANIRWFLSWERRTLEQQLGDFLLDKLKKLKAEFYRKVDGLSDRISEIETTVHDRRSSEIQLHQQRVESHCTAVQDELKWIQSEQAGELEAIRALLDEERSWMAAHELRSRSAGRRYLLQLMLTQITERETRFIDGLVERSAAFRRRAEEFSVNLVESTRAFLRQLVPQPPPEPPPPSSGPSSGVSGRGRRGSVRVSVLRAEARRASVGPAQETRRASLWPGHEARRASLWPRQDDRRTSLRPGQEERRTSLRPEQEARRASVRPVTPRRAGSSRAGSSHPSVGGKGSGARAQGDEEGPGDSGQMSHEHPVGNFSTEEVVRYKATLKKLLVTIDQTVKIQCKSLEHRMELFCGALDEAIKKAESSIRAQIGDVQFAEAMQQYYVSINTLIKTEMHLNQEETLSTKQLIRGLADQLDEYETKWAVNLRRESQLSVYFQPSGTVQWEDRSVGLSGCIMEGTAALSRVEEMYERIRARHRYLYYAQLNGTVPFSVEGGSESVLSSEAAAPSASDLPSAGRSAAAVVRHSADGDATVRLDDSAARRSLQSPYRPPRQAGGGRAATDRASGGSRRSGGRGTAGRVSGSAGGSESAQGPAGSDDTLQLSAASVAGSETAVSERPGSSGYTADVSASLETATATTTATAGTSRKSEKRRNGKKKVMSISRMEEPEIIAFLFGNVERPTDSNNFIQKVQQKILKVLHDAGETAHSFYVQKGSRAVTRPDLVPATYDDLLETLFARFQACYAESARHQMACFAGFCADFAEFVRLSARIPDLLFGHHSELYCRQVSAVTRGFVSQLSDQRRLWADTAADLDHRLRPGLGHPGQHGRLFSLVERTVDLKEAHLSRLRDLDSSCTAAHHQLQTEFDHSTAFVTARCRTALLALSSAGHLSEQGRAALTERLTEAVEEPREACRRAWNGQRQQAEDSWSRALRETVTACQRWTDNWFTGVESVQQLYRLCEA